MTIRLFAFTVAALTAAMILNPVARADDKAEKKKNKKKGPDIEAIFKKLDANNDAKLSPSEFAKVGEELKKKKEGEAAKKPGKGAKMAEALFAKLDADKSGSLSLDEFKKVVAVMKEMKANKAKKAR
jgi:Ca2+-binding EF-hand superfamily protein